MFGKFLDKVEVIYPYVGVVIGVISAYQLLAEGIADRVAEKIKY